MHAMKDKVCEGLWCITGFHGAQEEEKIPFGETLYERTGSEF